MSVTCHDLFKVHRSADGDAAALQGLTLDASAGEMLAVLGPSGSGKSTLLRILAGFERPSAGTAIVAGHDMARIGARARSRVRRRHIGFVGEQSEAVLSPVMTVQESLMVPLAMRGLPAAAAGARSLVREVGLPHGVLRARPHDLSGGERQRAALCVAVAHRPDIVLADEPTGELDAEAAADVLGLLRQLADDRGATVVLVTHDPAGVDVAHRAVRIRDGKVSAEQDGARRTVVIGKGGWLHVPEDVLARAGIGERALLRSEPNAVVLEAPEGVRSSPGAGDAPSAKPPSGRVEGAAVTLRAVAKSYGSRRVLEHADFHFAAGRFTAVVGRSGSGKSTLLHLVCGLEQPDDGEVHVAEQPLAGLDREQLAALRAAQIGFVAQDVRLASFLSAEEHVALPLMRAGRTRADAERAATDSLLALGLGDRRSQRVGRLSAGERQRVAIARGLAGGRRLLLVDEPTSSLDEANAAMVAALLRTVADDHGATVVCATHDPVVADAAHHRLSLGAGPRTP